MTAAALVIDSSALIAILEREPESKSFVRAIWSFDKRLLSAVTYQESCQVTFGRRGSGGLEDIDQLLEDLRAEIVPHDEAIARLAVETFTRYGKGIHPNARLNFCDCAAYATAKALDAPLLFKGNDFAATDVVPCPMPDVS